MVESAAALRTGLDQAQWTTTELWVQSLGIGGSFSQPDIDAIVAGDRDATPHEHDVLASTLNDFFTERGLDHPVPYWSDLM